MNKSFTRFLKEHQAVCEWNKYYIPTKKLGEWAKRQFSYWMEKNNVKSWDDLDGETQSSLFILREITSACLKEQAKKG